MTSLFEKLRYRFTLLRWKRKKRVDENAPLTAIQEDQLTRYWTIAQNRFRDLGIDIESKSDAERPLYNMVLLFLDENEVICPAPVRTANLMAFLDSLGTGWQLPPATVRVSKEFAKEVDGYLAVEMFRNHLGLDDIRKELVAAINSLAERGRKKN